jgi:hypothetical protein
MSLPEHQIPFKKYRITFKGITGNDGAADLITRLTEEELRNIFNYTVEVKSCKEYTGKII